LQTPSPTQLRDALEQAVIRDLLGPAGGAEEEIDEPSVCDRYLVGVLAPRRQAIVPEEFDDLAVAGEGTPEEGSTDIGSPQAPTMFPSSFGMTFSVDGAAQALKIIVHWGRYDRARCGASSRRRAGRMAPACARSRRYRTTSAIDRASRPPMATLKSRCRRP
jgi:hypothetical protein